MKVRYKTYLGLFALGLFLLFMSCRRHHDYDKDPGGKPIGNCFDGLKNQNETNVDCGGVCLACSNCQDGIKNSDETGIDCGGSKCSTCSPPSSPDNCSTLSNQTVFYLGSSFTVPVNGCAYIPGLDTSAGTITIYLNTNFNTIEQYDINVGKAGFKNMSIGDQRVYTTVDSVNSTTLLGGQAFVTITQGSFNPTLFYAKSDQKVYIKKISGILTQVWFCGLYTEDATSPQNTYYFSVSATF